MSWDPNGDDSIGTAPDGSSSQGAAIRPNVECGHLQALQDGLLHGQRALLLISDSKQRRG